MRALVVVPTYDEGENIGGMIDRLLKLDPPLDVLVVDDSSPDGTGQIVLDVASSLPTGRVRLLTRPAKEGLAAAYRDGFTRALELGYEAVVQMDADGSHPVETVTELLEALDAGADLALGTRYMPGGGVTKDWAWYRRALSQGGSIYSRVILGLPYRDLTGGFKAWRASTLRRIQPIGQDVSGYAFQIQTTFRAHRLGARIVEVPFIFQERELGRSKMSARIALEAVGAVWRIRRQPLAPPADVPRPTSPTSAEPPPSTRVPQPATEPLREVRHPTPGSSASP
jgi:dolichol-phosphate mannosyltransferase